MNTFTELVLLIGTNPLPNYVVAEYFLKHNQELKHIWLVHSEEVAWQVGTRSQAEHLEKVLQERRCNNSTLSFPLQKVALSNVSNAREVLHDTNEKLIKQLPRKSRVHTNYTGGTKAMGTHVYRAIEQDKTKGLSKSFSYLDGRNFQIVDDVSGIITLKDLRDEISISFLELITLHGFKRKNKDSDRDFSEAVEVFKKLIDEGHLDEYFTEDGGYNRTRFESKKEPGELARKVSELKDDLKSSIAKGTFFSVIKAMPTDYQLFNADGHFIIPSNNNQCEHAIKFLDGGWLEDYIHTTFQHGLSKSNITVLKDWKIDKEGWTTDFQIDVILLKGYQLIGISCTTSQGKHKKPVCKNHGFEIIHRTRQIGGDESKAILITLVEDNLKKTLKEELQLNTGITSGNILVLGKDDLKEGILIKSVTDFIHQRV